VEYIERVIGADPPLARTELRFLLAISLMFVVLVGTNLLFPPVAPEPGIVTDSAAVTVPPPTPRVPPPSASGATATGPGWIASAPGATRS